MSTYVISDIHGNLKQFKELLKKIDFKFDGTDILYLLGDYVDWGPNSIGVLKYVMEISKYDFVHVLIGNHDLMFLKQIQEWNTYTDEERYGQDGTVNDYCLDGNWIYNNRGLNTFRNYLGLNKEEQKEIENFLNNLPYTTEIPVGNKLYIAAHACPQPVVNREENVLFYKYRYSAVWERITRKVFDVLRWYKRYEKEKKYDCFICGHTITEYEKDGHFSIIINKDNYIDIDCGAKLLGYFESPYEEIVRLAAIRLDDLKEFYIK